MSKISILIVEDSDAKLDSIKVLLKNEFNDSEIESAYSVRSAIDFLTKFEYSLIIADMSLPTYDIERRERGGTPRPFGGIEVFEHLDRFELTTPVIVVTSYPSLGDGENATSLNQLRSRLELQFPANYRGAVYFDSAYSTWESEFVELINNSISK